MSITGTHISYYFLCHAKLWLFSNGITMEHNSGLVAEGRLIQETTYPQRSEKYEEIIIGGIRIDYYDPRQRVIHEVKKSDKMEPAHEWQVKLYIRVLEENGITGVTGLLEYPKLHRTTEVLLSERDRAELEEIRTKAKEIMQAQNCPPRIRQRICRQCSYYDFCWSGEESAEE